MTIERIMEPDRKSEICNALLRALPDWFGIEQSIVDYVEAVRTMPLYAAMVDGIPVGFLAIKEHNRYTAEVYVMGVENGYHRRGIGKDLIAQCEEYLGARDVEYLTVKTLDESNPDEYYARTRRFYEAMGFRPLEVFPTIWDESNPCLFMAKHLTCG